MDIFHCSSYPSFWIGSLSLLPKINFLSIGILERIPPYSHAGASSFGTGNFWGTMPCFCAGNMFARDWTEAKIRIFLAASTGNRAHQRQQCSTLIARATPPC